LFLFFFFFLLFFFVLDVHAPHSTVALGGQLVAQYPLVWRSQGGLAAEIAAVLDAVREGPNTCAPSLQKLENVCHNYDLGTEVARFQMRVNEVFAGMAGQLPRDLLKGLFDMTSEAAWWLLEVREQFLIWIFLF
jgi:hypothetical protein